MKKNLILGIIVIVIIGLGAIWYINRPATTSNTNSTTNLSDTNAPDTNMANTNTETNVEASPSPSESAMPSPSAPAQNVKEFTVSGQNFSFTPKTINVKKGDTVRVTFKNVDGFHDFKIDEFKVATKQISGGAEETVEFTADKTGSFQYYCSVGKHRANGMWGTLTVE